MCGCDVIYTHPGTCHKKIICCEFHQSCVDGNIEKLKNLKISDINARVPILGFTALHLSVRNGNTQCAKYLVEKGADINKKGIMFTSNPILTAILKNDAEMVEYLISKGGEMVCNPHNEIFRKITKKTKKAILNGLDKYYKNQENQENKINVHDGEIKKAVSDKLEKYKNQENIGENSQIQQNREKYT